jgi:eukaryotic-like serine/threonine-protein kinase
MKIINSQYEIIEILGEGGVGTTYKAKDLKNNQFIAIKVISFSKVTNWKTIDLFEREVRVLKQLNHPTIPQYLDSFEIDTDDDRLFCIVQALAPGKNLAQWMQAGWRPDEETVKVIAQQLLEICIYLQTFTPPIIHRDIKPQNILRDEQGQIYLVDFGAVQDTYRQTVTGGSTVIGTFGYMAPEQFRGQATLATDLYGLGTTLIFLLTGQDPINLQQTEDLKLTIPISVKITLPFKRWLQNLIEPAVEDRCPSAETAILFFQGQEELVYTVYQSILRPQKTNIQLIKTDDYLRIEFSPSNFFGPKMLKHTLASLFGTLYFITLFLCLFLIGISGSTAWIFGHFLIFWIVDILIAIISIRSSQILLKSCILTANEQFITIKGNLKPFQFYKEITFGLNYIDEIYFRKVSWESTACVIKNIEQEKFYLGTYLSASEQRWISHEIQGFIKTVRHKEEILMQENSKILADKKLCTLDMLLKQGISCYENDSVDNAKYLFKSAIILNSSCPEAHNNLGVVEFHTGNYSKAIEEFRSALRFAPSYWSARVNLAISYEAQGNFENSIKTYATPCPMGKEKGEDKYTLILIDKTRQSLADAMNVMQELNPFGDSSLTVKNKYAYFLHLQGYSEMAVLTYKDALKLVRQKRKTLTLEMDKRAYHKNVSETYANLGWVLAMVGQTEEALVNLKKSSRLLRYSECALAQKVNALITHYQQSNLIR